MQIVIARSTLSGMNDEVNEQVAAGIVKALGKKKAGNMFSSEEEFNADIDKAIAAAKGLQYVSLTEKKGQIVFEIDDAVLMQQLAVYLKVVKAFTPLIKPIVTFMKALKQLKPEFMVAERMFSQTKKETKVALVKKAA